MTDKVGVTSTSLFPSLRPLSPTDLSANMLPNTYCAGRPVSSIRLWPMLPAHNPGSNIRRLRDICSELGSFSICYRLRDNFPGYSGSIRTVGGPSSSGKQREQCYSTAIRAPAHGVMSVFSKRVIVCIVNEGISHTCLQLIVFWWARGRRAGLGEVRSIGAGARCTLSRHC